MLSTTKDLAVWEIADGATVEYSPPVVDEVRRLAVDGFLAFGHGGLEVGGVLYGARDGNRISVLASTELPCEHALGPGFVLSDNDRKALARLLEPPDGLQTVGWYRTHTRKGLDLDARDRELFEQFSATEKIIGLVLKPTHRGPSAAALYLREPTGEILPSAAREFIIEPLARQADVPEESEPVADAEASMAVAIATGGETQVSVAPREIAVPDIPRDSVPLLPFRPSRRLVGRAIVAVAALGIAACAVYYLFRAPRNLALEAYAIAPGQVRIEWNQRSLPVVDGASGTLQIRDGESAVTIPLSASQLRISSITYEETSGHITVRLRVERRQRGAAPAEESIEFVGPGESWAPPHKAEAAAEVKGAPALETAAPPKPAATVVTPPVVNPPAQGRKDERDRQRVEAPKEPAPPSAVQVAKREFQVLLPPGKTPPAAVAVLPAPPPAQATPTGESGLPDILSHPQAAPTKPVSPVSPVSRPYSGPRSGRLIWTGELGRRGVVEIEGTHASIGALSGSLSGVPVVLHIWPAEFTRDGLSVYTADGAAVGRKEPPSISNGWNRVNFQYDPERARELVVLEAPNRVNGFNRLVLRNDARACKIIVVDWTVQ